VIFQESAMNSLRSASRTAVLALGIWASTANADLPSHPIVQVLRPTDAEVSNGASSPPNGYFGAAVSVYKSMAIVGMPYTSTGSVLETGRVGVFTRRDGVWQRTGTFVSPRPRAEGHFGRLVALENDGAIIADETRMYVFKYTHGSGWKVVQWVTAPKDDDATLPYALDFRCNRVAASAHSSGKTLVYVYDRRADGTLAFKARLTSPSGDSARMFGASVAVDCNLAVVGDPGLPTTDAGSAYVYRRTDGAWHLAQRLIANDGGAGDGFGGAVAINQQTIFVGAPHAQAEVEPGGDFAREGATYIFSLSKGAYGVTDELHPTADQNNAYGEFGNKIRATDDRLFVGAHEFQWGQNGVRPENLIFTYARSGGTASPTGLARGIVQSNAFVASGTALFVGTPDDERCFECTGAVDIYDVTRTE
jgi:hypothetical protein